MIEGAPRRRALAAAVAVGVAAAAAVLAVPASSGAASVRRADKCSNLHGVQKKIPHGYRRGRGNRCVKRKPAKCPPGERRHADGVCYLVTPPAKPQPQVWWPDGWTPWTGDGTNVVATSDGTPLIAYQPSTCNTVGGSEVPNGTVDPYGRVCWSYLLQVNVVWSSGKSGCGSLFVRLRETDAGVIVGDTIGSQNDVPNLTPVQIRGTIYPNGHPNLTAAISSIDCYSP